MSPDKTDASIALVKQLYEDYKLMREVSLKDKAILKTMNKEIKTKATPQDKWDYIKANK